MNSTSDIFSVEQRGDTLLFIRQVDLRELEWKSLEQVSEELSSLYLGNARFLHVVVDLQQTNGLDSSGLAILVGLWKRVSARKGRLALCCVPAHTLELLQRTQLNRLWKIYHSREEALVAVSKVTDHAAG